MTINQKPRTNNPNGRPKGSKNRVTERIKSKVDRFLDLNINTIQDDFDQMEPKDRLDFIHKLLRFTIPTQSRVQGEVSIEALPDSQLDDLLGKIIDSGFPEG